MIYEIRTDRPHQESFFRQQRNFIMLKNTRLWAWLRKKKAEHTAATNPELQSRKIFLSTFGREPDLDQPKSFNEKLQYLKLKRYYHNPVITQCVDKYRIREYLTQKGHAELLPQLYAVCERPEDIPWDSLPERFVLKCNHGSGYNILCRNKSALDRKDCESRLKKWLKEDYWKRFAEMQYRDIPKRIIAEEYLGDDIHTYKFYCFNGMPRVLYISSNGENGEYDKYYDYFDMDWKHMNLRLHGHENRPDHDAIPCPESFERMKALAAELSADFPFVRVDLYDINGRIYISELTFVPTGGIMVLDPPSTDMEWGGWLSL